MGSEVCEVRCVMQKGPCVAPASGMREIGIGKWDGEVVQRVLACILLRVLCVNGYSGTTAHLGFVYIS